MEKGNYTTQLYRDYKEPLKGSLFNELVYGMESRKVFFVAPLFLGNAHDRHGLPRILFFCRRNLWTNSNPKKLLEENL